MTDKRHLFLIAGMAVVFAIRSGVMRGEEDAHTPESDKSLVTIKFDRTPLRDALQMLGKMGLNYVCTEEVLRSAPPVTGRFVKKPLMDVAKAVVKACGLHCVVVGRSEESKSGEKKVLKVTADDH